MNHFEVKWETRAEMELARLWMNAKDKNSLSAAQYRIDLDLAQKPSAIGIHISEGLWKHWVSPLVVYFEIDSGTNVVKVTWVRVDSNSV